MENFSEEINFRLNRIENKLLNYDLQLGNSEMIFYHIDELEKILDKKPPGLVRNQGEVKGG
jgi:hypothetical protein